MSANKQTVERYLEGFRRSNHTAVLACLTDDVEWLIPEMFHVRGKEAFDQQIENEAFVGHPEITVVRLVEEDNVVVAEGRVRCQRRDGEMLHALFCDVFELEGGLIKRLTSYLAIVQSF
jgi:uncharacterized protein